MTRYAKFKSLCLKHRETLGLGDWRFDFSRAHLKDTKVIAEATIDIDQKSAILKWNLDCRPIGDKGHDLEDTAAHEVLHVALAELLKAAATSHNDQGRRVQALEHSLINRLAPVLCR